LVEATKRVRVCRRFHVPAPTGAALPVKEHRYLAQESKQPLTAGKRLPVSMVANRHDYNRRISTSDQLLHEEVLIDQILFAKGHVLLIGWFGFGNEAIGIASNI
jgi:hypothetical protein